MANKYEEIREALTGPMTGLLSGVDLVYPNQAYEPTIGTPHARMFILPNQPSVATLGATGQDVHTGTFQVSLYYPKSETDFPIMRAGDIIETEYQKYVRGGYLSSGQTSVRITSVGIGNANADDAWSDRRDVAIGDSGIPHL